MCIGGGQPDNPTNTPKYAAEDSQDYFTVSMEDEEGNQKQISKRSAKENEKLTGHKVT